MIGIEVDTKRGRILCYTAEIMAQMGYEQTTFLEVAKLLKVKHPAIYYYFPSKRNLFDTLIDLLLMNLDSYKLSAAEMELLVRDGTVMEVLEKLIYRFPDEDRRMMIQLLRIFMMNTFIMPEMNELYQNRFVDGHRAYIEHQLNRLRDLGKIQVQDTHQMAIAINDAINYRALRSCMFRTLDSFLEYSARYGMDDMIVFRETVKRWLTQGTYSQIGFTPLEDEDYDHANTEK